MTKHLSKNFLSAAYPSHLVLVPITACAEQGYPHRRARRTRRAPECPPISRATAVMPGKAWQNNVLGNLFGDRILSAHFGKNVLSDLFEDNVLGLRQSDQPEGIRYVRANAGRLDDGVADDAVNKMVRVSEDVKKEVGKRYSH